MSTMKTTKTVTPSVSQGRTGSWLDWLIGSPWPAALIILGAIGAAWYDIRSEGRANRAAWQAESARADLRDQAQPHRARTDAQPRADRTARQAEKERTLGTIGEEARPDPSGP